MAKKKTKEIKKEPEVKPVSESVFIANMKVIQNAFNEMTSKIVEFESKLDEALKPKEVVKKLDDIEPVKKETEVEKTKIAKDTAANYVPQEYRNIVDEILGSDFGISIEYVSDKPEFIFTVVVPIEYSNVPPNDLKDRGGDLRTKVMSIPSGVNEVREWATKIKNNLGDNLKRKVISVE